MRHLTSLLVAVALAVPADAGRAQQPSAAAAVAFTRVTVIDVVAGTTRPDMTVLVIGDRIGEIGRTGEVRVPDGAREIDGAGKFLIPGLWDMHVHEFNNTRTGEWALPLFVANGVTNVRHMGHNSFEQLAGVRSGVTRAGRPLVAPRLAAAAGMDVNGPMRPGRQFDPRRRFVVHTPAEARRAIDSLRTAGADFVKAHGGNLTPELYREIMRYAAERGLTVAGHVPHTIDVREASDLGQRSIEHMMGIPVACSSDEAALRRTIAEISDSLYGDASDIDDATLPLAMATFDEAKCATLARHFARNGTALAPTLVVFEPARFERERRPDASPLQRYVSAALKVDGSLYGGHETRRPWDVEAERLFAGFLRIIAVMHRAGVRLLAASDTPYPHIYGGFSLHDELAIFVRAGLTPAEALRTATIEPARFLGREKDLGTVATGKLADLVLLDADALADIGATRKLRAVMVEGRLYDPAALLAEVEAAAKRDVPPPGRAQGRD